MDIVLPVYKPIGHTPLDVIKKLKEINPTLVDTKIAYAGRLDPMAEGLLLLLIGDECKKREQYERLPKTYELEVLFGLSTDSYDILGLVDNFELKQLPTHFNGLVNDHIQGLIGKHKQKYPPYSAGRVQGKPLYWWARNGRLDEVNVPEKEIEIYALQLINVTDRPVLDLEHDIISRIQLVHGAFRQEAIRERWKIFFQHTRQGIFPVYRFSVSCSSGTYVRSLAHEMGKKLGIGAVTFSIKRSSIGHYTINDVQNI